MSYYSRLRPFYSSVPTQRFQHLVLALDKTCNSLLQPIQEIRGLAPVVDKNYVTDTHKICQIMLEAIERISDDLNSSQISASSVTNDQLHALKFDLYARSTSLSSCASLLERMVCEDNGINQGQYSPILIQIKQSTRDVRDILEALYNPQERISD